MRVRAAGLRHLWTVDEDLGKVARIDRERTIEQVLTNFSGRGIAGDTTGNSPGTNVIEYVIVSERQSTPSAKPTRTARRGCCPVLMSLHAEWTEAILAGRKRVELRRT